MNSVLKGYYNGLGQIDISAKIQIIEQIIKTVLTIIIVEIISRYTNFNTSLMAEGSMIAASFATILSLAYSINKYRKLRIITSTSAKKGIIMILKEILSLSIPISISSFMMVLEGNIDSITIIRILKEKLGESKAQEIYGIITSKVNLLVGLPGSLIGAIAMCLIPEISRLNAVYAKEKMKIKIDLAMQITLFISVPITLLMIIFSNEIMQFLYPNASKGAELLKLGAITIPFVSLTQIMSGILQGLGDAKYYLKVITIGIMFKLIFNIILISEFLGKGAIISSLIVDMIIFSLIFIHIKKIIGKKTDVIKMLVKITLISLASIIPIQMLLGCINFNFKIKFILEIICIIIMYLFLSVKLKIIKSVKLSNTNYIRKNRNF
jgi:stage V sporulation protein B